MKTLKLILVITVWQLFNINSVTAQTTLPLAQIDQLEYQGAFIIPDKDFGESSANYSTGSIAVDNTNKSIFLSGHRVHGAIAEFSMPELVNSTDVNALNTASIKQNFKRILNKASNGNPQGIDEITGLTLINNKLIVNAIEYYDAPNDNTHTSLIIENPSDISSSPINGYYKLDGAAHAGGWISPIPNEWQELLEGDYIAGNSSKYPINSRHTMGPSAFIFKANNLLNSDPSNTIPTTPVLDFDLSKPMYAEYLHYDNANYNLTEVNGDTGSGHTYEDADATVGKNDLWTEISQASYGFIVPGTRTYLTIGSSGGHDSGIGYKATQNNENLCPGPCPYDANDNYNYYWLWDVNDFLEVKNGSRNAHEVRPYAYGVFEAPFQTDAYSKTPEFHSIVGGTYDSESGLLYLSIYDGGAVNSRFSRNPVIAAYKINGVVLSTPKNNSITATLSPNPASDFITVSLKQNSFKKLVIYNKLGQLIKESNSNKVNISEFASGLYFVNTFTQEGNSIINKLIIQ